MRVDLFDYHLPEELIALEPPARRDGSRLLHVSAEGVFNDHLFRDLPSLLQPGDLLVLNDTKVFPAALRGVRAARPVGGGGDVTVDVNLLTTEEAASEGAVWRAFLRPGKRVREGDVLTFGDGLEATFLGRDGTESRLAFNLSGEAFRQALQAVGSMPLPPYIARRRAAGDTDKDRYQTVFAREEGSVAAPTAGLHFTTDLLETLQAQGHEIAYVTLHVGAGTFLPVATDDVSAHQIHTERGSVTPETAARLNAARSEGRRIVCVGTTSVRILETAATEDGEVRPFDGDTSIFITPGYRFRATDAMITNFHLPRSTLLMLISAFCGRECVLDAYAHAIEHGYRFYSYGDACLLERQR